MSNFSSNNSSATTTKIVGGIFGRGDNVGGGGDLFGGLFGDGGDDLLNSLNRLNNKEYSNLIKVSNDLEKYYLIVLAVLGVPSNALTVATIFSMHALSPATFFVGLLAIFDGCALVVKFTGNQMAANGMKGRLVMCAFMDPLSIFFTTTANWILVLICLERFISVCYPLKKVYLFTKRRSYIAAAVMVAFFFTLIMTLLGVMRTSEKGRCTSKSWSIWFYKNVWPYINAALYLFIPLVLIVFLTGSIIHGLRKSRRHRKSLMLKDNDNGEEMKSLHDGGRAQGGPEGQHKSRPMSPATTPTAAHNKRMLEETARVERTITLMLIAAGSVFLILSLPMALYYLIRGLTISEEQTVENARWSLFHMIAYILIDSTHAVNFLLYFFTAKRFRVQLFRVVTCRTSCWGRRISQRGGKGGANSKQADLRRGSRFTTSSGVTGISYLPATSSSGPSSPKLQPVAK